MDIPWKNLMSNTGPLHRNAQSSAAFDAAITPLWPWQPLLQPLPTFAAIASRYPLTLIVASLITVPAPIDGWLLHPSLLFCPMPTLSSTATIIHTFIASCWAILFFICAILFLIAPLPPSTVVIPLATAYNPCTPLCPSHSLVWLSLVHPSWLMHCILSRQCFLSAGASASCLATASCCPSWMVVALPPLPLLVPLGGQWHKFSEFVCLIRLMSAALPEPSPCNTGLVHLWMLLGKVACKWRGDINKTGQWGGSIMQRAMG